MFSSLPTQRIIIFAVVLQSIRMLVGSISAVYLLTKGLSITDIGLVKALQAAIILLFDIPLSYFADKKAES